MATAVPSRGFMLLGKDPTIIQRKQRKTPTIMSKRFGDCGKETFPLTGRNLEQNQVQGGVAATGWGKGGEKEQKACCGRNQ